MEILKNLINSFKSSTRARQSLNLLLTNFTGIPLGILTSVILTKILGAEGFGDYSFIISIFVFSVLFLTFGFFQAGNRALVLNNNIKRAKQYYGAELVILLLIFSSMTVFLSIYGFTDQNLKEKNLSSVLLTVLPLGLVFLANNYIEVLLQADNRITLLSMYRLLTKLAYVILLVSLLVVFPLYLRENELLIIFYLYFISQTLVFLLVLLKIKPSFSSIPKRLKNIWLFNKVFGFNIYIGSVFSVGFTALTPILIGYFSDSNSSVGFYALALTFTAPLAMIPNTIATVYYKEFSRIIKIPRKIITITIVINLLAILCLWLIITPFIQYFYGEEFIPVIYLSYIISLGVLLHGFGDFYNRFLGANGQSIALRNSSFIVGGSAMLIGIALIPKFGEYGAAATRLIIGFIYLITIICYYSKYTKSKLPQIV